MWELDVSGVVVRSGPPGGIERFGPVGPLFHNGVWAIGGIHQHLRDLHHLFQLVWLHSFHGLCCHGFCGFRELCSGGGCWAGARCSAGGCSAGWCRAGAGCRASLAPGTRPTGEHRIGSEPPAPRGIRGARGPHGWGSERSHQLRGVVVAAHRHRPGRQRGLGRSGVPVPAVVDGAQQVSKRDEHRNGEHQQHDAQNLDAQRTHRVRFCSIGDVLRCIPVRGPDP